MQLSFFVGIEIDYYVEKAQKSRKLALFIQIEIDYYKRDTRQKSNVKRYVSS